jgi:hypothetical protein
MVSVRSKLFYSEKELCKFINDNRIHQSQVLAITSSPDYYTLFYYA